MSYCIDYSSEQSNKQNFLTYIRLPVLILLCIVMFMILTDHKWPEGAALIHRAIQQSQNVISVSSLNNLTEELRRGEDMQTAFSTYFRKFIR